MLRFEEMGRKASVGIIVVAMMVFFLFTLPSKGWTSEDPLDARRPFVSKMAPPAKTFSAPGYCDSWGGSTSFESIRSVTLTPNPDGTYRLVVQVFIANPTGCTVGEPCPEYDTSPEYVNVWIDWNGDGFWDESERVMDTALTGYFNINYWGTMTAFGQFTPPIDVTEDPTWLRANLGWGYDPDDPCMPSWAWGDVVDQQHSFKAPMIKNITAKGVGTAGTNPETGSPVRLEAELETPAGYEVDACSWTGDLTPGNGDAANNCRYEYTPATGVGPKVETYGEKRIKLTVTFRHTGTGATGQKSKDHTYKVFFKKGTPGAWGDDNGNGIPNWFEYWRANAAVPGLGDTDVFYDQTLGNNTYGYWSSADDNVHVGGAAAMTHYPSGINVPATDDCPGGTFGGAKGIDCAAEVVVHEHRHKTIYHNWDAGGVWEGWTDSDRGVPSAAYNDGLPDVYEWLILGTATDKVDSCNLATYKSATYATYGDNEFDVMTLSNGRTGIAANDWANPGKQTNPAFTPPHLFTQHLLTTNMKSGPPTPNAPYGMFPIHPLIEVGGLTGVYSDAGVDTDGNSLYNSLKLSVGVEISLESMYNVVAWLEDSLGTPIGWANTQGILAPGSHTVELFFDGVLIRKSGKNGPYKVARVELREGEIEDLVASADNVHTTAAYLHTAFDLPIIQFTKTFTDAGVDTNGDSLFNWLRVNVNLQVQVSGSYKVIGEIEGSEVIGVAQKTLSLSSGLQSVPLDFDGQRIFESRENGPYQLRRLRVEDGLGNRIDFLDEAYLTGSYSYTAFQHGGAFIKASTYGDQALDIDGDGDFDYLRVGVQLNVAQAGNYQLSADLTDGTGELITSVDQTLNIASAGDFSVTLDFVGSNIYQHGINGPYRVSRVTLLDGMGNIADYQKVGYTTQAYNYSDFGAPWVSLTGQYQDYGVDTNSNGRYDQLVIEIGVLLDNDGVIVASGRLVDASDNEIEWGTNTVALTAGAPRIIPLTFNGKLIRTKGVNGPFKLTNLYVYNTGDPGQGASASLAHTTAPYPYTAFECEGVCTAPDINVSPALDVNFGNVAAGSSSDRTLTVQNTGDADLQLVTIGAPTSPFTKKAEGTCASGTVLSPGASCTIVLRFAPTTIGAFSSSFDISSNDPDENPVTITLTGNGIGIPDITVAPTTVGFGNVLIGNSVQETISVQNDGASDLTLGTIGTPSAPFSRIGGTCTSGQTLSPGGSCSVVVAFSPTLKGSFASSFAVPSNDPDETSVSVSLSGVGVLFSLEPQEGTLGSLIDITGSGFGSKKSKALVCGLPLKVLQWGSDLIQGTLTKVLPVGFCDVSILPKEPKGAGWLTEEEAFSVEAPSIETVTPNAGAVGSSVKIAGLFFGTKKGKVLLGGRSCKVLKWSMDPKTGESEIEILIPKGVVSGHNELKVLGKVGEDTAFFVVVP